MTAADLMRPGFVADQGFKAAHPLLVKAGELMGFTSFFENFVTIAVLLLAWAIVLLAFFLLAVQLFIAILEFKLTALAGFVLVPFALFGRTAFLAERVLGHVISSGIKLMVLAIVVGIGSAVFGELIKPITGEIALAQAAGAGNRKSSRLRKGAPWLKTMLVQCAWAAIKKKDSYYKAQFNRLKARRGPKKAICAVAASMLTAIYHMLKDGVEHHDLGAGYFDRRPAIIKANRLVAQLAKLGFRAELQPLAEAA
jgi:hypothetical protein